MSHNMEIIDGLTSFARADCEPDSWWSYEDGLTQQVFAKGAKWAEVAPLANLNYECTLQEMVTIAANGEPMWDEDGSKMFRPVREWKGGTRDGMVQLHGKPFTGRYSAVQIADMAEFAKAIEAIMPGAYIATAGAVRNGNRPFISVRLGDRVIDVNGFPDRTNLYLSILNSWDGSAAFAVANGSYRTECDNTFSGNLAKLKEAANGKGAFINGKAVYLKHTGDMASKLETAKRAVAEELGWADAYTAYAQKLAQIKMTASQFDKMVKRIFVAPKADADPRTTIAYERKVANLKHEFNKEVSDRGGATAWGALNAFTYMASHNSIAKGSKLSAAVEIESRVFGDTVQAQQGASLVDQVMAYLNDQVLATV